MRTPIIRAGRDIFMLQRWLVFVVSMLAFSGIYLYGSTWNHTQEDAQDITDEFALLVQDIDGLGIFMHNVGLTLPMFVPFIGVLWGNTIAWATGFTLSAIVTVRPEIESIHPLSLLYMTPFGIMELTAYSLAISRSILLSVSMLKKKSLRPEIRPTLIEVGIAAGLLLVAGLIEYYMIELIESGHLVLNI